MGEKINNYQAIVGSKAVDRSLPFGPTGAFPLDARSFFDSLSDARNAARGAIPVGSKGDTTYYHGQLIGVLEYPNGIDQPAKGVATYYIIQPNGNLTPVGSGIGASIGLEYVELKDASGCCEVKSLGTCQDTDIFIPEYSPSGLKVIRIADGAFKGTLIRKITFPDTLESIGSQAFEQCANLVKIVLPDAVHTINHHAFCSCVSLKEIVISKNLSSLSTGAFEACSSLESIIFPAALKSLAPNLCKRCLNLKFCVLPKDIRLDNAEIFEGCDNLATIYYSGSKEDWSSVPKTTDCWQQEDAIWKLATTAGSGEFKPITLVYNFAIDEYGLNVKLNSEIDKSNTQFNTFTTGLGLAGASLITEAKIESEGDDYCLIIDPTVFSSNI